MMRYVTYDESGNLTGSFLQEPPDDHLGALIEVAEGVAANWPAYRANEARDGVQPLPQVVLSVGAAAADAIAKTYRDVDAVYAAAVGNRGPEYQDAEAAARAFVAAGYVGEADPDVADFARDNPTGLEQTPAWAADQIIARADAFRAAQKAMRSTRFARQAEMRAATTLDELAAAVAAWDGFIAATRAGLGL